MNKWTEEYCNIGSNDLNTGMYSYQDDSKEWTINLAYSINGWPVLSLVPDSSDDLRHLKTIFPPEDYKYIEWV